MGIKFIKDGSCWSPIDDSNLNLHEFLDGGTYTIKQHLATKKFQLEEIESFDVTEKLYGDISDKAKRIINTFLDRPSVTGVLLSGEKGSGKTLLAKVISRKACALYGIPTIIINCPYFGDEFNRFIQEITQPAIIIFDEFEKVYKKEEQECILTLLDGVFSSKKMFIFTCNDIWRISDHMSNRPGRIFYSIEYAGLDCQFIQEYCDDALIDKSHTKSVCSISSTFEVFNFDILKALVEEMNRYNENPFQAIKMLNASPVKNRSSKFSFDLWKNGLHLTDVDCNYHDYIVVNPLTDDTICINWSISEESSGDDKDYQEVEFTQKHLVKLEPLSGKFTYDNGNGFGLVITRVPDNPFDMSKFVNSYVM